MAEVIVTPREGLGIASVMARKGANIAVVGERLGAVLPDRPQAVFAGGRTIVGTGPGTWLVFEEQAALDFVHNVAAQLAGPASVSDQSSGYVVQRISGPGARTLLRRGVALDVDMFVPGSAATSVIAHIGVILWQVDDAPTYDIATFRSYAGSFRHWLDTTIAGL